MHRSVRVRALLRAASRELDNPREAAILLAHHLGQHRHWLITHDDAPVEDPDAYTTLIARRKAGEPIEYITGEVSFYGEMFQIAPGALIPRPETELLIDHAKEIIAAHGYSHIAEIGTGSGIIAVMLARLFPGLHITATDINPNALDIARKNAEKFGVRERVRFVHTSFLEGINQKFAMILSNPPYIAEGFVLEKPLAFEPQNALFGGKRGDEILREIIDLAAHPDSGTRHLLCEMGYDQKAPLAAYMLQKGIEEVRFYRDYSGFDRGFIATLKE
ncbi:MAG TPA: peptide chain release factor N(5)-glutamine methyltransferase [Campylobacteraceae bacterium]|nr:peptide chain release factor N(5)-glutamine methyltransferase [Campylobacteraceae bacterium]